jgi:hypothetical protein
MAQVALGPPPPATAGRQSQLGTLHLPGPTVSAGAGPSIGLPARALHRTTSEGTVQVVVAHAALPNSPRLAAAAAAAAAAAPAQPASSAAPPAAPLPLLASMAQHHPEDSTAVSQADGAAEEAAAPRQMRQAAPRDPSAAAKPTDSFSSAAAGQHVAVAVVVDRGMGGAGLAGAAQGGAPAGAASLASHHAPPGVLDDDAKQQAIDMPAPPPPGPAAAAAAAVAALATTPAAPRMGSGVLLTPGHGLTPLQLQSVVSAALGRAGPLSTRPGDSCSSGNRPLVLVGLKRKKAPGTGGGTGGGVGRPPMAPPAQILRTAAQPTASSAGAVAQQADNLLAVEDAVSMVEHGLEGADIEVACDAVSEVQGEEALEGEGMIGSGCPSLAGPGASIAGGL